MKKSLKIKKYAMGTGSMGANSSTSGSEIGVSGGAGWGQYAQMIPQVMDGIIDIIDNNPNKYSKQPTLNASTMRNMVDPYNKFAFGGEMGDMNEETMSQLQEMADAQGISVEDLIQQLQSQQDNSNDGTEEPEVSEEDQGSGGEEFAYGGLAGVLLDSGKKRKKNNTTISNNYDIYNGIIDANGIPIDNPTVDDSIINMAKYMMNNNSSQTNKPSNIYRPEFQHHSTVDSVQPLTMAAYGGKAGKASIEVEGDEVLETPSGNLSKMVGPSHEDGGIDVSVPKGTKIFSDRLKVDGKTMQERKLDRERKTAKLDKLIKLNPTDKILKNTMSRTAETTQAEEEQDMKMQKIANAIYAAPTTKKFAYGGDTGNPEEWQGFPYPYPDNQDLPIYYRQPIINRKQQIPLTAGTEYPTPTIPTTNPIFSTNVRPRTSPNVNTDMTIDTPIAPKAKGVGMTTGDYVGLAGNLWNAIAPIVNTNKNAAGNKPNINRFRGFGRKAIETNDSAQTYVAAMKSNALSDVDSAANSSYERNVNSARGVNTLRALNIATDVNKNKAKSNIQDSFSKQMMSLLGQKGQLENLKDKVEMTGATQRDIEDKADRDNYYSAMAQNLTNFGSNVQGIGKSLNVAKSNKVDSNLISQLSKYGLTFDENGNLVNV